MIVTSVRGRGPPTKTSCFLRVSAASTIFLPGCGQIATFSTNGAISSNEDNEEDNEEDDEEDEEEEEEEDEEEDDEEGDEELTTENVNVYSPGFENT